MEILLDACENYGCIINLSLPGRKELEQRPLSEEDVCPICQETLLTKRQPVTYCRFVFALLKLLLLIFLFEHVTLMSFLSKLNQKEYSRHNLKLI